MTFRAKNNLSKSTDDKIFEELLQLSSILLFVMCPVDKTKENMYHFSLQFTWCPFSFLANNYYFAMAFKKVYLFVSMKNFHFSIH